MEKIILKDYLKTKFIRNKYALALMSEFFRIKNGHYFYKEVEQRRVTDILNYKLIALPLPYCPIETVIENNYYGLGKVLSEYAGLAGRTNTYIEHGVFFGPNVVPWEREWKVKRIIAPSLTRLQHLRSKGIQTDIGVVGPYIHYAKPLLSPTESEKIKSHLGKVLLVFPTHSIVNVSAEYDIDHFISYLKSIRAGYDTVLICLYWLDALKVEIVRKYESCGFMIVTAGNRFDFNFLNRLKSLILLADDTVSNDVGTHVGYCIYLNRSHYIFAQEVSYAAKNIIEELRLKKSFNKEGEDTLICDREINEVKSAFSVFSPGKISDFQIQIVNKYWGLSEVKNELMLRKLLV